MFNFNDSNNSYLLQVNKPLFNLKSIHSNQIEVGRLKVHQSGIKL